jgi:hypothetical protein
LKLDVPALPIEPLATGSFVHASNQYEADQQEGSRGPALLWTNLPGAMRQSLPGCEGYSG